MPRTLWWIAGVVAVAAAATALGWTRGRAGRADAVPAGESSPATPARRAALTAPGRGGPAPSADLAQKLRHPDPVVRARVLSRGGADDATVLAMVRDDDVNVAAIAGELVVRRYRDGAFSTRELAALYRDTSLDLKPRISILNGISAAPDPEAAELLVRTLASGSVPERRAAANLIAFQDRATAVPRLVEALADEDEWVRSHARDSLRNLADGEDFGQDAAAWTRWWSEQDR